ADVGSDLAHLAAQFLRSGGTAFVVDVEAVGLDTDRNDLGPELPERFWRHLIGRPVGAIDDDAQAVEADRPRQRALGKFDVAVAHAIDALGAAEIGTLGELLA